MDKIASSSVLDDRETLLKLIDLHNRNRLDYNERKWETIKFFHALTGALLVASITAFITVSKTANWTDIRWPVTGLLALGCAGALSALWNLERESRLLFIEEFQMFKYARLAGLDVEVPEDRRWLPGDRFLLPHKWRHWQHGLEEYGVEEADQPKALEGHADHRTKAHGFLQGFSFLFALEALIAIALIVWTWSCRNEALPNNELQRTRPAQATEPRR